MDDIKGRPTPFRWREGRVKYWDSAAGSQYQVGVFSEYAVYGHGYCARRARGRSTNVHVPEESQPRVGSSVIKLVSTVLTRRSAPTVVELSSVSYLDFGVIRSDAIPHEPVR